MADASDPRLPLSALLQRAVEADRERISVDELMSLFGGRALGALLFIFGLLCTLPLPPGGTTIFGFPLLLLAPQLMTGAAKPWLPAGVRRRTLSTADLRAGLPRALPWLRRVEAVSKPRLSFVFGPWGQRLIGLICTLLAFVLILPIPLGNILPAISVTVLSFSLIQRDGYLALLGFALTLTSASVLVLAAHVIAQVLGRVLDVL